jgi:hypothetical protein
MAFIVLMRRFLNLVQCGNGANKAQRLLLQT